MLMVCFYILNVFAVTSILGIITAINDPIIETTSAQTIGHSEPSSSPYSLCVTLLKDPETLVEVGAQQFYGDDKKWNFIAATEAIKRLRCLANTGRHRDPGNLRNYYGQAQWNLEGRAFSALNRFGEKARMVSEPTWLHRVQHQQAIMERPNQKAEKRSLSALLSEKGIPGGLFVVGEVMFIMRPLLYLLLIRKYGTRSWFPWFTSLALDLIGNGIVSYISMSRSCRKDPFFHLSNHESDELKRRKLLWALYLMRDPFFTKYTRGGKT